MDEKPFLDINEAIPALASKPALGSALESLLGIKEIRGIFAEAYRNRPENTFAEVLKVANINYLAHGFQQALPKEGGVMVIANHPFGGADAMSLTALCNTLRPDTKVIGNSITSQGPGMDKWVIPVDILEQDESAQNNQKSMRQAFVHLRRGGVLTVFPAGAVSYWQNGKMDEPEWSPHITRLAQKAQVPILPIRYFGYNPLWFQILGKLHPLLRTAMIPNAFLYQRNRTIHCAAGEMISAEELNEMGDSATDIVRKRLESIREP